MEVPDEPTFLESRKSESKNLFFAAFPQRKESKSISHTEKKTLGWVEEEGKIRQEKKILRDLQS